MTSAATQLGLGLLDRIGNTPLLRLERLSRWLPAGVEVYAKAEFTNPGGSVKDRAAKNMIMEAIKNGELTKDKVLLDSTSGNTGIAYAMIGAALGYRVELVMPENASEKKRIIEAFGAKVIYTDPLEGSDGAQREAQRMYKTPIPNAFIFPTSTTTPTIGRPITKRRPRKSGGRPKAA